MLIAGVDEAGRGPCLGPLVVAVACLHKRDEEKLLDIGVKDSKQLPEQLRKKCYSLMKPFLKEYRFAEIEPQEIDSLRDRQSLNEIEAMRIGFLLNELKHKPEIIFVDSPDIIETNFAERIKKYISFDAVIRTEHKADFRYPVVSAASIIAKVERDKAIKKLSKEFGDIGSGYPSDPVTKKFLSTWMQKHKSLPPIARKSWHTSQQIEDSVLQKKIFEWK